MQSNQNYYLVKNSDNCNELFITTRKTDVVFSGELLDGFNDFTYYHKCSPTNVVSEISVSTSANEFLMLVATILESLNQDIPITLVKKDEEVLNNFLNQPSEEIGKIINWLCKYLGPLKLVNLFETQIKAGIDFPIKHNRASKAKIFSFLSDNHKLENIKTIDLLCDAYVQESKKSNYTIHRYPFWDKLIDKTLTRSHLMLVNQFAEQLEKLIEKDISIHIHNLQGKDLWQNLKRANPVQFNRLASILESRPSAPPMHSEGDEPSKAYLHSFLSLI